MGKLILIRHGKSLWNVENIFTGWTDIDLAPEGIEEAKKAGELIKNNNILIDICFTSYLQRAIKTVWFILETANMMNADCIKSWKLNERHYGAWQGRNKDEVRKEVGEDLFWKIRRGYDMPPPSITAEDEGNLKFDKKYKKINPSLLPLSESLENTQKRVVQYFFESIVSELVKNKTVLVSAHGNSLRALMGQINNIPSIALSKVEVPTGVPNIYEFDDNLHLKGHYQLK